MSTPIKKILNFYNSENPGVINNLSRILNHGYLKNTGKIVILPVDQGFEHGPLASFASNMEAHDPHYHFKLAIKSGCNAYAAPLGFLQAGAREFAGEIPLILKLNNSESLYKNKISPISALTSSVDTALQLGCVAVGFTIYPGSADRKQMYEEIAEISEYARHKGLVVVIWSYPRGNDLSKTEETALDVVSYAAHIAAQLGAHIIKIKPPSQHIKNSQVEKILQKNNIKIDTLCDRVRYIMKSAFNNKRIVIFSGGPAQEKSLFLQEIRQLAEGGSFGSIVGRNAFTRPLNESVELLQQIMEIYKQATKNNNK